MDDELQGIGKRILERLSVRQEYEALGLRFTSAKPNEKGWITCHKIGSEDKRASAGVNAVSGLYHEFSGEGRKMGFFEAATLLDPVRFPTWREAQAHYADKAGVPLANGKAKKVGGFRDNIRILPLSPRMLAMYEEYKPGVTADAALLCGAATGLWPGKAPPQYSQEVIGFPVHAPDLSVVGYVVTAPTARDLSLYQGKEREPLRAKAFFVLGGKLGLIGYGLERLATASAIWIVEGISDMVALVAALPPSLLYTTVVLTNAAGGVEAPPAEWLPSFTGRKVYVCRDRDETGVAGAVKWHEALRGFAEELYNVDLPYPIVLSHGKDVRDFLVGGGDYAALLSLPTTLIPKGPAPDLFSAPAIKPVVGGSQAKNEYKERLDAIGIETLGEYADGTIEMFSSGRRKLHTLRNINYLSYADLLQLCGDTARDKVAERTGSDPTPGMFSVGQIRNAIAYEAGKFRLTAKTRLGQGVWEVESSGDIAIVDSSRAYLYDGSELKSVASPRVGTQIIDLSPGDHWCDFDALKAALDAGVESDRDALSTLEGIVGHWVWGHPADAKTASAMIVCTWIQTLWHWRPLVAITGGSDAGKSLLMEDCFVRLFGGNSLHVQTTPTAAGLRQNVGDRACALLIDEFEHSPHRTELLQLLRTSSKRGGTVLRGSSDQKGRRFSLSHIAWIAATESGLKKEPDRNRWIALEMRRVKPSVRGKTAFLPPPLALAALGVRLLAASLRHARPAMALAERLRSTQLDGVPGRAVESYAVPAAMYATIMGYSDEAAGQLLAEILSDRYRDNPVLRDDDELLADILTTLILLPGGTHRTPTEILTSPQSQDDHVRELARCGICLVGNKPGPRGGLKSSSLFLGVSAIHRNLLRGTRWHDGGIDIESVLMRLDIDGQRAVRATRTCGANKMRGVLLPACILTDGTVEREESIEIPGEQ